MSLPISFFKSDQYWFDIETFIPFWTGIQHMLKETYVGYDFEIFDREFEKVKNKKFYEFTEPQQESMVLRDIIYQMLQTQHKKTPIMIIKDFFGTIKDECYQRIKGHSIYISHPPFKIKSTQMKEEDYDTFIKQISGFSLWPHHYIMKPDCYNKIKTIQIEVYFALIATCTMLTIDSEAKYAIWGN